jgi:hypothetical protein
MIQAQTSAQFTRGALRALGLMFVVLGGACGRPNLPKDHGLVWQCIGDAFWKDCDDPIVCMREPAASYPPHEIGICANGDVPVEDVDDACKWECEREWRT